MSLLGIDVGTTGCKVSAFSTGGDPIASAYDEYDVQSPQPGWAELDARAIWEGIKQSIAQVSAATAADPITALSVSSLGEATVPVTADRQILGPSILNFDDRGKEYVEPLRSVLADDRLYRINGNTLGNHYSLTKLQWIRDHKPELYANVHKFLHWSGFVSFMLGADPVVDFSLANRTLLFDVDRGAWSEELLERTGVDRSKLPDTAPSGTCIGTVSPAVARELGLPKTAAIVTGAHDQCANAVGCGVIEEGCAMFGMGTYHCIVPVFVRRKEPSVMIKLGLNTEHHAVPRRYVSFIYNQGGILLKWFRDTFAVADRQRAVASGREIYAELIAEIPEGPSPVLVLPHFVPTGPPDFIANSSGVIAGLRLNTTRGDILKGILEGTIFYLRECVESLPQAGIDIADFRVVGGGSKSDAWVQICADILDRPLTRLRLAEAGALGAAILAGTATGVFSSPEEGVRAMVKLDRAFEPDRAMHERYNGQFERYRRLWPRLRGILTE